MGRVLVGLVGERPQPAAAAVEEVRIFQVEEARTYPAWRERTDPSENKSRLVLSGDYKIVEIVHDTFCNFVTCNSVSSVSC